MFSAYQQKDVKTILLLNQWIISVDYQRKFGKVSYGIHNKISWYRHWKSIVYFDGVNHKQRHRNIREIWLSIKFDHVAWYTLAIFRTTFVVIIYFHTEKQEHRWRKTAYKASYLLRNGTYDMIKLLDFCFNSCPT